MRKRTGKQIRALVARLTGAATYLRVHDSTYMRLRDVQCVLQLWNAAAKLRRAISPGSCITWAAKERLLAETAWLIEPTADD